MASVTGVTRTRHAALAATIGAALFLACCLVVRGGPLDHAGSYGDTDYYGHYAHLMAGGKWPYRDFFDEYPPLAQPLFLGVQLLPGPFSPAFRWTMTVFGAAGVALLLMTLAAVGASRLRMAAAAAAAGVSPLLAGPVFLNAYDLFPALLMAAALLAFVRGRETAAYVLLALGVAAKIYPVVLLPFVLIETWERGGREQVKRGLTWFVGVLFVVHLPFAVMGPGGLRFSYWVQLKRGLESESLGAAILLVLNRAGIHHSTMRDVSPGSRDVVGPLATAVGIVTTLVLIAAVLAVVWLYLTRRRSRVLAAAAAVTAFVAFSKVFSPQYMDWLVPLVPGAGIVASGLLLAALVLTRTVWNHFVTGGLTVDEWGRRLAWWVLARDLVVVAIYGLLVARLMRREGARRRIRP
jgi:uncharacterized membrane protein